MMSGEVRDKYDQDGCAYEIVKNCKKKPVKKDILSLLYLKKIVPKGYGGNWTWGLTPKRLEQDCH